MLQFAIPVFAFAGLLATAADLEPAKRFDFVGDLPGAQDLSAVALLGDRLALASDETAEVTLLEPMETAGRYQVRGRIALADEVGAELDLEGLAATDNTLYVLASHAAVRHTVDNSRSRAANRKRLRNIEHDSKRDVLARVRFTTSEEPEVKTISLRNVLEEEPLLATSLEVPSKENGLDLEGLAVVDKTLFIGCRGPVLRGNWVPVLVARFKDIEDCELRFVNLRGLGIRDLVSVTDGLLVLAGPIGAGPGSFELYHWDGADCLPGNDDVSPGALRHLGTVPCPAGGNAEGVAVLSEESQSWRLLVVYDDAPDGAPTEFEVKRVPGL